MNPVESNTNLSNASMGLGDVMGALRDSAQKATPKLIKASVGNIVAAQVQQLVDEALAKARPEIDRLISDSLGPTIQDLIRDSVLSKIKDVNLNVVKLLGEGIMGAKKKARTAKKASKKTAATGRKVTRKVVEPTRGRFQLFDIKELSVPFMNKDGRTYVTCKYADGTKRIYSLETIVKNKDPLAHILGPATMKRIIGKA